MSHGRMWQRAFVLEGLAEITAIDPGAEGYLKSLPLSRLHRPDWSTVSRPLPRRGCNPNPPSRGGNLPRPATYDLPEASILHRFGSLLDGDPFDFSLILFWPLRPLTGDMQGEDMHVTNCDAP